jgi:hypothetical protein
MNVGAKYQIPTAMPAIQMSFFCFGFMVTLLRATMRKNAKSLKDKRG